MQEAAAEKFDMIFEVDANENSDPNVSKMLANSEDLASRPYRSRTCDTLIRFNTLIIFKRWVRTDKNNHGGQDPACQRT